MTFARKSILIGLVFAGLLAVVAGFTQNTTLGQDQDDEVVCEDPEANELEISSRGGFWEQTNFCNFTVEDFSSFRSGGVRPDGIPPIDEPQFESIEAASEWLQPQSPVIALELEGEARAYPLAILTQHEIVNDFIGEDDLPIAVTFCPLCNSALVFDRTVDDQVLRFGVSGLLRNSDLVMWDDATRSWWQQLTGEAVVGDFAGTQLTIYPSLVVGFGAFTEQFPEGTVLSRDTGINRTYGRNPYAGYDSNPRPFLFDGEIDDRLPATERVLAGIIDDQPMAYPFSILSEVQVINDTIGERDVVVFWQPGKASALDDSQIDTSRDVGTASLFRRELDGEILTFSLNEEGNIIDNQTGSTWNVFGVATEGELEGSRLRPELAAPHFWFAWAAFRPETGLYELPTE